MWRRLRRAVRFVVRSLITVALVLVIVILLQQGKGGDIANAFGGGGSQAVFGARTGATLLTKITAGPTRRTTLMTAWE